ncbi:unnamed protein product, partial [Mesorhabditis belari]|uniref:Uncharacterized protein n=1 Tax=Mesorhabditis belari TaxID=2138241 RepID=A0AAF3EAJ9_9BILA
MLLQAKDDDSWFGLPSVALCVQFNDFMKFGDFITKVGNLAHYQQLFLPPDDSKVDKDSEDENDFDVEGIYGHEDSDEQIRTMNPRRNPSGKASTVPAISGFHCRSPLSVKVMSTMVKLPVPQSSKVLAPTESPSFAELLRFAAFNRSRSLENARSKDVHMGISSMSRRADTFDSCVAAIRRDKKFAITETVEIVGEDHVVIETEINDIADASAGDA